MSNKLRLAIVLPCIQVLLAFALLRAASHQRLPRGWDTPHTSDAALVCVGISAGFSAHHSRNATPETVASGHSVKL
jgi:hypothetical protein